MTTLIFSTFTAEFEGDFDYETRQTLNGKVVLRHGRYQVAEFPTDQPYMDADDLGQFVADKFGELFAMLADYQAMSRVMDRRGI